MDILIKGLDMPKDRDILYIDIYSTGKVAHDFDLECKQIATAVSVPPHGRLIDAEKIYDAVEQRYRISSGIKHRCERDILDLICDAPTIIEAGEGK